MNTPVKVAELADLNLGGRDFLFLREERVLFVAMSDMNITSRLDAYLTNVCIKTPCDFIYSSRSLGKRRLHRLITMLELEPLSHSRLQKTRMKAINSIECGPRLFLLRY